MNRSKSEYTWAQLSSEMAAVFIEVGLRIDEVEQREIESVFLTKQLNDMIDALNNDHSCGEQYDGDPSLEGWDLSGVSSPDDGSLDKVSDAVRDGLNEAAASSSAGTVIEALMSAAIDQFFRENTPSQKVKE